MYDSRPSQTTRLLEHPSFLAVAVLLTVQVSAAAYGVCFVREVVAQTHHQLVSVARAGRR
jgi:hypothetical protein